MANSRRVFRVSERIQAVIANQLIRMSDPRFFMVTITAVVVSRDLRHAKVYWMVSGGGERVPHVQNAFESATGMIRSSIAKELDTRSAPELRFYYDDTLDAQERVNNLFERLYNESSE